MNWATQRRTIIVIILGLIALAFLAVTLIATLHETPSCTDQTQNQEEAGIDCGGPCPYLCSAQVRPPITLFTRALSQVPGRTDVFAVVSNPNLAAAAKNVRYTVTLFDASREPLRSISGTLDLPSARSVEGGRILLFVPFASTGTEKITAADLSIDAASIKWFSMESDPRVVPTVGGYTLSNELTAPRLTVSLENESARPLTNIKVVASLFDAAGNVIAASQTVVPSIPEQGSGSAVFTWNAPFNAPATRVEVQPVVELP